MNEIIAKVEALYAEVRDHRPVYGPRVSYGNAAEGYALYQESLDNLWRAKQNLKRAKTLLCPKED